MIGDRAFAGDRRSLALDLQLETLCHEFAQAWRGGQSPRIQDYLRRVPANAQDAAVEELVAQEVGLRRAAGQSVDAAEYYRRFPQMRAAIDAGFALVDRSPMSGAEAQLVPSRAISVTQAGHQPDDSGGFLQLIPGYQIVREVGRGGMGVVYEALRKSDQRSVALKVVVSGSQSDDRALQLFLREATVLSQLRHKRIVQFYELGMAAGQIFLAMEYLDVVDLRQYLAGRTPADQDRYYCGVICQVLEALTYAHGRGLVHRDIKPQNILVTRAGNKLRTKLADFGLAKYFQHAGFSGLTSDGETRGTVTFMPPEQFADSRYAQPPVDLYAAGASLYYYLTEKHPYDFSQTRNVLDIGKTIKQNQPTAVRSHRRDLPAGLAAIVDRAVAKVPEQRFSTARDMYRALYPFARKQGR